MADGRTRIRVSGTLRRDAAPVRERKRIADPQLLSAYLLAEALRARDIEVSGPLSLAEPAPSGLTDASAPGTPAAPAAPALRTLAAITSASLAETVADINMWSNNFMAEMLLLSLGVGPDGEPATWARAVDAATGAIAGLGIPRDAFRIVNGSGLYDATRVSPRALATLLATMARDPERAGPFQGSLAVAGESGTLRGRFRHRRLRGKLRAKTGTLDKVLSLSGYLPTRRLGSVAFSIMVSGATPDRHAAIKRAIDRLVLALAGL